MNSFNAAHFKWLNQPEKFEFINDSLVVETEPETDFWQRTFYGFSKVNAPAYLTETGENFTFRVKTSFETKNRFDQCGVLLYIDDENWVKVSVEHENEKFARLGSVATNLGYSDWATTDIPFPVSQMWYAVSRKNQDVFIEFSKDGTSFSQMRILHLHKPVEKVKIGIYACSPLKSSFAANFSELRIEPCNWPNHNNK